MSDDEREVPVRRTEVITDRREVDDVTLVPSGKYGYGDDDRPIPVVEIDIELGHTTATVELTEAQAREFRRAFDEALTGAIATAADPPLAAPEGSADE